MIRSLGVVMEDAKYRAIAEDLRRQIESGELRARDQLPTESELSEVYGGASRNTVRDAIKVLVRLGLIEARAGQGTFVTQRMVPFVNKLNLDAASGGVEDDIYKSEVERQGRKPEETAPRVESQLAPRLVATQLELATGALVISRHQERKIDGTPWSMQTTFYPMDFFNRGASRLIEARDIPGGVIQYLEESLKITQVGWRDVGTIRAPTGPESVFFGLTDKVPVAVIEFRRTSFDEAGKPIRVTFTVYAGDRNKFELEAGRVPPATTLPPAPAEDPVV
jgi:GntR family transcriptional regulator